jgi:hypothetical protein
MSPSSFSKERLMLWLVFGLLLVLRRADSHFGAILQLDFGDETIATRIVGNDLHATVEIVAAFAHRKLDARIRTYKAAEYFCLRRTEALAHRTPSAGAAETGDCIRRVDEQTKQKHGFSFPAAWTPRNRGAPD